MFECERLMSRWGNDTGVTTSHWPTPSQHWSMVTLSVVMTISSSSVSSSLWSLVSTTSITILSTTNTMFAHTVQMTGLVCVNSIIIRSSAHHWAWVMWQCCDTGHLTLVTTAPTTDHQHLILAHFRTSHLMLSCFALPSKQILIFNIVV